MMMMTAVPSEEQESESDTTDDTCMPEAVHILLWMNGNESRQVT